ncbi:MAG: 4-(cytidine 5'-diphospho)-2-C-methyl-D-erythritol kinase [Betaproteobacteria bacterium]|nr:4-(cytidine 5'-diphospho)-2-C-methyl-D-erythritol kinase [Betaproteobacteria bacterium]
MSAHSLRIQAPAKLNLFLHVNGRRSDGYHLLQTVFVMIDHMDVLDIAVRPDGQIRLTTPLDGVPAESDLTVRAARALQLASASSLGADLAVDKRIPMGGGLGGGSSDAAAALLALNRLWRLDWPLDRLAALGVKLGADVPFFVRGCAAWGEGVGDVLTPVEVPAWWYVVLTPDVHVPTPWVFGRPELTRNSTPLKIADFSASGLGQCRNDLQPVVLKAFPKVAQAWDALDQAAARTSVFGARMTGSGACIFAAFETRQAARETLERVRPGIPGFVAQGMARHPFGQ